MEINHTLNQLLVNLFRTINTIEERAVRRGVCKDLTANDMHVIEAIGTGEARSMGAVAQSLSVTTGTLTTAVNSLVKKGYVRRERGDLDRRLVLISLTEQGRVAYEEHSRFHQQLIDAVVSRLSEEEKEVLGTALEDLSTFFHSMS